MWLAQFIYLFRGNYDLRPTVVTTMVSVPFSIWPIVQLFSSTWNIGTVPGRDRTHWAGVTHYAQAAARAGAAGRAAGAAPQAQLESCPSRIASQPGLEVGRRVTATLIWPARRVPPKWLSCSITAVTVRAPPEPAASDGVDRGICAPGGSQRALANCQPLSQKLSYYFAVCQPGPVRNRDRQVTVIVMVFIVIITATYRHETRPVRGDAGGIKN